MKKSIRLKSMCFIAFCIITLIPLRGQSTNTYNIGTTWHYEYREGMDTPNVGYIKHEIVRDTIIESKKCLIIDKTRTYYNGEQIDVGYDILFYDEAEHEVFQVIASKFYLLYDFKSNTGDTINVPILTNNSIIDTLSIVIDSVVHIEYNNSDTLTTQYFHQISESPYFLVEPIIEMIGAKNYFFPTNSFECDGGCPSELRCFNNVIFSYESSSGQDCEFIYNIAPNNQFRRSITQIYPNPVSNSFTVNSSISRGACKIINIMGQVNLYARFNSSIFQLDCSDYQSGSYFLIIENDDKEVISRDHFFVYH